MEFDKFLKVDKIKLVLFIVLIVLSLTGQIVSNNLVILNSRSSFLEQFNSLLFPANLIIGNFYKCGNEPFVSVCFDSGDDDNLGVVGDIVFLVIYLILSYLFVCVIVVLFKKLTKK